MAIGEFAAQRAAATRDPLRLAAPRALVKPQLIAEITYLTWTEGGLLRQRFK